MKHINGLESGLSTHLAWNKSRIGCLARMVLTMIAVRTVNLVDIACAFGGGQTKALSHYRRLQRFFSGFDFSYAEVASLLFGLFAWEEKVYLSMDRTNWQWGKSPIKRKKHGRLAKSPFRHGLDFIRETLFFGKFSMSQFRQCLAQFTWIPGKNLSVLDIL